MGLPRWDTLQSREPCWRKSLCTKELTVEHGDHPLVFIWFLKACRQSLRLDTKEPETLVEQLMLEFVEIWLHKRKSPIPPTLLPVTWILVV